MRLYLLVTILGLIHADYLSLLSYQFSYCAHCTSQLSQVYTIWRSVVADRNR